MGGTYRINDMLRQPFLLLHRSPITKGPGQILNPSHHESSLSKELICGLGFRNRVSKRFILSGRDIQFRIYFTQRIIQAGRASGTYSRSFIRPHIVRCCRPSTDFSIAHIEHQKIRVIFRIIQINKGILSGIRPLHAGRYRTASTSLLIDLCIQTARKRLPQCQLHRSVAQINITTNRRASSRCRGSGCSLCSCSYNTGKAAIFCASRLSIGAHFIIIGLVG